MNKNIPEGKISPITLIIEENVWDKFKRINYALKSKGNFITLNDYVTNLIKNEVTLKEDLLK